MEAKAAPDLDGLACLHRLPAVPLPLAAIGGGSGKPGPLQFVAAAKMDNAVTQEAFCIRWKGFTGNIVDCLGDSIVRGDEDFADVSLSCCADGGGPVRAHKLILASCSNYFRKILRETSGSGLDAHPIIVLGDVDRATLEALVTYMYRGEVFVSEDRLPAFFAAAQSLEIKGIADPPLLQNSNSPPNSALSRGFPFAALPPPVVLPSSPSSTSSSASSTSPSVHPVGDLSLLAAAASATQRPPVEAAAASNGTKRRKTTPRRLEVVSSSSYKAPKLDPDTNGTTNGDAINLSTKHLAPDSVSSIYVSKAGLLNIPNPIHFGSSKSNDAAAKVELPSSPVPLDMTRPGGCMNGTSPLPLQIGGQPAAGAVPIPPLPPLLPPPPLPVTSPTGDAENASPNLAADASRTPDGLLGGIKLPKVPVSAVDGPNGQADEEDIEGEGGEGEKDATSPPVDGLLPVSSSTTAEQMAALLGPSWKSRQPRMCQYCQRMFSNKFNLKQVRKM